MILDEMLKAYFDDDAGADTERPYVSECMLRKEVEARKRKTAVALMSFGSLLWLATFICIALLIGRLDYRFGLCLLVIATVQLICSGLLSCIVIKFKKVGGRL
jgi:hypothetical protein